MFIISFGIFIFLLQLLWKNLLTFGGGLRVLNLW